MGEFNTFYAGLLVGTTCWAAVLVLFWRLSNKQKGGFRLIIGNILLFAFLGIVILLSGETYYRFFIDRTDSFALNKLSTRWGQRHYQYNNLRARDNIDYQYQIESGKRRLSIIGDSFTAGHGVKNIEDRFANIIRNQHPELEVHVIAANGLETIDELGLVRKLHDEGYQFDMVLLVYCLNDIAYLLPKANAIYERIYSFNDGLGYFGRNSYFVNTLMFRWFALNDKDFLNYSDFVLEGYSGETFNTHKQVMQDLKSQLKAYGAGFKVVTFPFLHNANTYAFNGVHENLNDFWRKQHVDHLDLRGTFEGEKNLIVNRFDAHPNEKAHKLTAEAVESHFFHTE